MKKKIFITFFFLLIATVLIQRVLKPERITRQDVLSSTTSKFSVTQTITYGDGKQDQNVIQASAGESALDLLSGSKKVIVKETSFGKLVEAIEGDINGSHNKYWTYSINGKEATIGAAEYQVQPNDSIEWKFTAYEE